MWSQETAPRLLGDGVRVTTSWDVAAVQRLVSGRWRADPEYVWARLHGVPDDQIPGVASGEPDLFSVADDDQPAQPLGAAEALRAAELQQAALAESGGAIAVTTARAESTVELLCAELAADGLPVDRAAAEDLLAETIGARTHSAADAAATRAARDGVVLGHAPAGVTADLRSPGQVRTLLAAAGIDVPDTRAHRLEEFRDRSPLVAALLDWRKAERIATTYGYAWLDENLGPDGRLRGAWTGCDGAAGRMTASSGLHNIQAMLRRAVIAEPGHVFVRADLGQIEPRVLAAVSGDAALTTATAADRHVPPGGGRARRRPAHRQGRDDRRDVRADHRARRHRRAGDAGRVPGRHGLPRHRRPVGPGREGPAHLRRAAGPDVRRRGPGRQPSPRPPGPGAAGTAGTP